MLFKQMQYFIIVVECESFTEAAHKNFISQSAISQQIKLLEQELEVKLIIREGKVFSLTEAGVYFYRHAKAMISEIDSIKIETKRLQDKDLCLRIGYPKNFNVHELQQAIMRFYHKYPEVSISTKSGTHEELYEMLVNNDIDFKISEQRRAYHHDYMNQELQRSTSYVEISDVNSLSNKEIISVDDLKHMPCILVISKGNEVSEKNFYEKDLGISHQFIYVDSIEQARLMVAGNRGYLLIDVLNTRIVPSLIGIKRIPFYKAGQPIKRNYFMCWCKKRTTYYIEEFSSILKEVFNNK